MATQAWHPAGEEIRTACAEAVQYCSDHGVDITRLALSFSASFEEVGPGPSAVYGVIAQQ